MPESLEVSAPFPPNPLESALRSAVHEARTELYRPQVCDHCASPQLQWIKCKLICRNCRQIVMSCADL